MSETAPQLSTDIEVLQARLATALAERDAAIVERGIVQCDGYAAYKSIASAALGEAITLASAVPICAAASLTSPRMAMRRSRAKRSNASRRSMRSRKRSAG